MFDSVRGKLSVAVMVAAVGLGGCEGDSDGMANTGLGNPAEGVVTPGGAEVGAGGTPRPQNGACNSLDLASLSYLKDLRGGAVPAMNGGSLIDGTYVLTRYEWHNPINALHTRRTVMTISGGKVQWASHRNTEKEVRLAGSVSTSGQSISFAVTCGGDPLPWDRFSTDGNTLVLHDLEDTKTATFVRR